MTNCPLIRFQQPSSALLKITELPNLLLSDNDAAATDLIDRIKKAIVEGILIPRTEAGFPISVAECIEKTKSHRCDPRIKNYLGTIPSALTGFFTPYSQLRQYHSEESLQRAFADGLVQHEHVTKIDLENWLRSIGLECEFVEPLDPSTKQKFDTTAKYPNARMKLIEQDDQILVVLREMGHDPVSLPPTAPGKSGVKKECATQLANDPLFQAKTSFSKAWERLRTDGKIKNRKS